MPATVSRMKVVITYGAEQDRCGLLDLRPMPSPGCIRVYCTVL